jgi:two-component system LytT family response regulator
MTSQVIEVVIVDDEPLARERLHRLLSAEGDTHVAAVCSSGDDAVKQIVAHKPGLVFLDVQMPGLDGFEVVAALMKVIDTEEMPAIVFVTAYDSYAIRAFDARAIDYLVKPFDDERFQETLDRVRRQIHQGRLGSLATKLRELLVSAPAPAEETASAEGTGGRLDRIVLKTGTRARIIRAEEVDWIAADGVYARLHFDGSSALIRTPLHELETRLDPARFVRVHRSTIVNLDRVRELREVDRGEYYLVLNDSTRVRLSRSRRAHLEAMLGQRL